MLRGEPEGGGIGVGVVRPAKGTAMEGGSDGGRAAIARHMINQVIKYTNIDIGREVRYNGSFMS